MPLIRYCSQLPGSAGSATAGNGPKPPIRKLEKIRLSLRELYKHVERGVRGWAEGEGPLGARCVTRGVLGYTIEVAGVDEFIVPLCHCQVADFTDRIVGDLGAWLVPLGVPFLTLPPSDDRFVLYFGQAFVRKRCPLYTFVILTGSKFRSTQRSVSVGI